MIEEIKSCIRDVPDFPKKGIVFKDITPILKNQQMCSAIVAHIKESFKGLSIDVVAGIESRGFLFGMLLANALDVPFVPIRKAGKLPYQTKSEKYNLEYGTAEIEVHIDAFKPGQKVLLHDDLLATGGTIQAAAKLVQSLDAQIAGFSFVISLDFLQGALLLKPFQVPVESVIRYT